MSFAVAGHIEMLEIFEVVWKFCHPWSEVRASAGGEVGIECVLLEYAMSFSSGLLLIFVYAMSCAAWACASELRTTIVADRAAGSLSGALW